MKNILVIHYSQSGQLTRILNQLVTPLKSGPFHLTFFDIKMEEPFLFPWKESDFFSVMPHSYLMEPSPLVDTGFHKLNQKYDLIIFGYQIWYLSPSIPTTSFLSLPIVKKLFNDTPIITVIGCRNMWVYGHEKLKKILKQNNANYVGNIVLQDRHINHISVLTISHWMFTGEKTKKWGVFPLPGVSEKDIFEADKFGGIIKQCLLNNNVPLLQDKLNANGAVQWNPFLVFAEKRAQMIFGKWAIFCNHKNLKKKKTRLKIFRIYLYIAIWFILPIVYLLFWLSFPFRLKSMRKQKKYFRSCNYVI